MRRPPPIMVIGWLRFLMDEVPLHSMEDEIFVDPRFWGAHDQICTT